MKYVLNKIITLVGVVIFSMPTWAQDIIVTNNAKKIEAKILEVSKSEIRYKEVNNLNGPTFVLETKEISSIIYSTGKVVLYSQAADTEAIQEQPKSSQQSPINENTVDIILLSGTTITAQVTELKSNYIAYVLDGKSYTLPSSQIEKVLFKKNGQIKVYNEVPKVAESRHEVIENSDTDNIPAMNSENSGRIYRENGRYVYNGKYISFHEVAHILELENGAAYKKWNSANAMIVSGSLCMGVGLGLALGGIAPAVDGQLKTVLIMECTAVVPLCIGIGLALGSTAQYSKAVDLYNSKFDHAAVQLKWSVAPTGVGLAFAF